MSIEELAKRYICFFTVSLALFLCDRSAFASDGDVPDSVRGVATVEGRNLDRHYLGGLGKTWQNDEEYANFWINRYEEQERKGRILVKGWAPGVFGTCGTVATVFFLRARYWATKEPTMYDEERDSSWGDSLNFALWATLGIAVSVAGVIGTTVLLIMGGVRATRAERKLKLLRNGLKKKTPPKVSVVPFALKRGTGLSLYLSF